MTLTIDIAPELEQQLRADAARRGVAENEFIVQALRERLAQATAASPALPAAEARLLQQINQGLPPADWQRYNLLISKRRGEILTADEQSELVALSDRIEELNATRVQALADLARLRQIGLPDLMRQLGITPATDA